FVNKDLAGQIRKCDFIEVSNGIGNCRATKSSIDNRIIRKIFLNIRPFSKRRTTQKKNGVCRRKVHAIFLLKILYFRPERGILRFYKSKTGKEKQQQADFF